MAHKSKGSGARDPELSFNAEIHEFMYTIQLPSDRSYYLRPGTILEARSLIHSLRWLLYQLGYDSKANSQSVQPWTKYST